MAKRKGFRAKARRAYGFARKKVRRYYNKSNVGTQLVQPDAMVYGALRPYVSKMAEPFTSKIPLGTYADNIAMAGICWLALKFGKGIPMLRGVAMKGLVIENALTGGEIAQNIFQGKSSDNNSSNWINNY